MALFCCTRPRSYSRSSLSDIQFGHHIVLPPSPLRAASRKTKLSDPARRQSKQEIEAFYQEGKRLQQEEIQELGRGFFVQENPVGDISTECETSSLGIQYGHSVSTLLLLQHSASPSSGISLKGYKKVPNLNSSIPAASTEPKITIKSTENSVTQDVDTYSSFQSFEDVHPSIKAARGAYRPPDATQEYPIVSPDMAEPHQLEQSIKKDSIFAAEILSNPQGKGNCSSAVDVGQYSHLSAVEAYTKSNIWTKPIVTGVQTPEYLGRSVSGLYTIQPQELGDLLFKLPQLLEPSTSSLAIRPGSPIRTCRTSLSDTIDLDQTPKASRLGRITTSPVSDSPTRRPLGDRDKVRLLLDSSSSYYTSEVSSVRSSMNLSVAPVPPVPIGIVSSIARCFTGQNPFDIKAHSPFRTPQPLQLTPQEESHVFSTVDNMKPALLPQLSQSPNPQVNKQVPLGICAVNIRNSDIEVHDEYPKFCEVPINELIFSRRTGLQSEENSSVLKNGSSIWGGESTKQPLLPESAIVLRNREKQWDSSAERLEEISIDGNRNSIGMNVNDMRFWRNEQRAVGAVQPRSLTLKKTFMSKLRSRLSSNLRSSNTLILTAPRILQKNTVQDGRGHFAKLHTNARMISAENHPNIYDYVNVTVEDITPNSEQVMEDITFTNSIEVDKENGLIYESVQVKTTSPVPQHRYSAIYDDCVVFPFGMGIAVDNEEDEFGTSSALVTPCTFSTASEMRSQVEDPEAVSN